MLVGTVGLLFMYFCTVVHKIYNIKTELFGIRWRHSKQTGVVTSQGCFRIKASSPFSYYHNSNEK